MDSKRFGESLRARRLAKSLTQQGLADATNGDVSRSRIQDYERASGSPPTRKAVRALARALGVGYEDLTGEVDEVLIKEGEGEPLVLRYRLAPGVKLTPERIAKAERIVRTILEELGFEIKPDATPRRRAKN